ncbi:peptidase T [Fusobacterium sp.]|uniref:peptidase T n=1 Tax=Fusobacterium sp. TaxID=68766 RepID=UPI002637F0EC|nr:peptidase T [Fusobacterium sp.]
MENLINRFFKYVKIDSYSDPDSITCPSSDIQWNIAKVIVEDLKELGLEDVSLDENCYIMAKLPSNSSKNIPTIGFIAHMDTAPSYSGKGVNPRIVKNYDGKDICLNEEKNIILSPKDFKSLTRYIGQDLIVADGNTLLGADDKAGIVEIIEAIKYLKEHPEIEHGEIKIGFTPDEEIGRGANLFDVKKFNCQFAYTVDGGEIGELEYENFNAATAIVKFQGRDIHPGTAKNSMINSILLANELNSLLPVEQRPEYTENYEGFFLLCEMNGTIENTKVEYIIRDHSMEKFNEKKELIKEAVAFLSKKYKDAKIELELTDSYYNMREKIEPVMYIVDIAKKSMEELDLKPKISPIRGGTDGARLSYNNLPCPNLFTGGHNFHGKFEYIPTNSMLKAKELIVRIVENVAKYDF